MFWQQCCFLSPAFLQPRSTAIPTRKHATNRIAVTTTAKDAPKFSIRKRKLWKTATNSAKSVQKRKKTLLKKAKSNLFSSLPNKTGPVSSRPFLFVLDQSIPLKYSIVRLRPSSSGISGLQPRSFPARVMSGRRTRGSSPGSGMNTSFDVLFV